MPRTLSKDGSTLITDEVWNTVISAVGAGLALIGTIVLVAYSWHKPWHLVGFLIYGLSLLFLFIASALHHGIDASEKTEHWLRQFDYFAIYLLIAGTFTPLVVVVLRNGFAWLLLALLWGLALFGIVVKGIWPQMPRWLSTVSYVVMAWIGAVAFLPLYQALGLEAILLLLLGGLFYTGGSILYQLEKPNPFPGKFGFHEIWHLCVMAGATSHFFLIYWFVLPY